MASELLAYRADLDDPTKKRAKNLLASQARIAMSLGELPITGGPIVLDGHYALLNGGGAIRRVPADAFLAIRPVSMVLLEITPSAARCRLAARDDVIIPHALLARLMAAERANAHRVSAVLGVPLLTVYGPPDVDEIARFLVGRSLRTRA